MATGIPNMINFHKAEHGKGLRFEPHMHFIESIASSMGSKRAITLLIHITDQKKEKLDSYITMFTSYDLLLATKGFLWVLLSRNQISSSARNPLPRSISPRRIVRQRFRNSKKETISSRVQCLFLRSCLYLNLI